MNINYNRVIIFTKHTDLVPYFESKYSVIPNEYHTSVGFNQYKNSYAKPRDVQLVLLIRDDDSNHHPYCKIKCPINPLPIRGEFEVVSVPEIVHCLERNGWSVKQRLHTGLFE